MGMIQDAVEQVARGLQAAGAPAHEGWIVDPRAVWERVRVERPEIAKAIVRHYGAPQRQVAEWVPRRPSPGGG